MDRRKRKTRDGIFMAFDSLIAEKDYGKITIQEIIDKADIGRSTFYDHFETKDHLLKAKCHHLFDHVFLDDFDHDIAIESHERYVNVIEHILCHLRDNKKVINGILNGDGANIFFADFRVQFKELIVRHKIADFQQGDKYYQNFAVETFADLLKFWMANDCDLDVKTLTQYYFQFIQRTP